MKRRAYVDARKGERSGPRVVIKSGRKILERIPFSDLEEARDFADEWNRSDQDLAKENRTGSLSVSVLMAGHLASIESTGSEGHARFAHAKVQAVADYFGDRDVRTLSERDIREYARDRFDDAPRAPKGGAPKVVRNQAAKTHRGLGSVLGEVRLLAAAINALVRERDLDRNPGPEYGQSRLSGRCVQGDRGGPGRMCTRGVSFGPYWPFWRLASRTSTRSAGS